MSSVHEYNSSELPAAYFPGGCDWMAARLSEVGYTNAASWWNKDTNRYYLSVDENHISKNQLQFDVQPPGGQLRADTSFINAPPGQWKIVPITGPPGTNVMVKFSGVGFVPVVDFVIPGSGKFNFQFGPCPTGQRVMEAQRYEFIVAGTSISPVSVLATFK